MSATTARAALASGAFSAVDYVCALLERIQQANDHLHAFVSLSPESALRSAQRADRRRAAGFSLPPLHGLPFAVKDLIDVRGTRTSAHSRLSAKAASKTAAAVLRLQRKGGIYLGKLALEEFGIGSPLDDLAWPSPKNPWDRSRTAGGSSSGSADAPRLSLMKTSAILVNTARGEIVDEEALIAALCRGAIASAGLDVYRDEPHIPSALRSLENAVLLPHLGSATDETRVAMGLRVVANLDAIVAGQTPPDRVA